MKLDWTLSGGETLHLFLKPVGGAEMARVTIAAGERTIPLESPASDDFLRAGAQDLPAGPLSLDFDETTTALSLAYVFHPDRVTAEGIRVLFTTERNRRDPHRYRLHAAPTFGWINDPNGFSEVDGLVHLFFQHYPHSLRWNTMHWGHLVSKNGIDWVQQPIFLLPRTELLADDKKVGGAFSGSALVEPDGSLRIFYTDRQDDREPNWEWQVTATTQDRIAAGPSTPLITETPAIPGFRKDFRDPYVFRGPDGRWKMLLGGGTDSAAVILLYESEAENAASDWRFVGVVHHEETSQKLPAECPGMVALDGEGAGLHLLIFGLLGSRDAVSRRRNITIGLVGRFDGRSFTPQARYELDYGTDAYGFQGIVGKDGPYGIAWAANWTDVFKDQDFPSCMTLPRRFVWQQGSLSTPPIDAVIALRTDDTPRALSAEGTPVPLKDGLAELEITLEEGGAPFTLDFAHPDHHLSLGYEAGTLELFFTPPGKRVSPRYFIESITPRTLRIFIDVGLIEIYVDGGRWCITKRIDSIAPIASVALRADAGVAQARILTLRPQGG